MTLGSILRNGLLALVATAGLAQNPPFIPEYESGLEHVIMHKLPNLRMQQPLIEAMPEGTRIDILTSEPTGDPRIKTEINLYYGDGFYDWAQDMFETIRTSEKSIILVPKNEYGFRLSLRLMGYGYKTELAPFPFQGGNVTYDRWQGKNLLFIGSDSLCAGPCLVGDAREQRLTEITETFRADETIVLDQYDTPFFHIDQTFLLIRPGEVVVNKFAEDPTIAWSIEEHYLDIYVKAITEEKTFGTMYGDEPFKGSETRILIDENPALLDSDYLRYSAETLPGMLDDIAAAFAKRGYTVHRFEASLEQAMRYQSYMNSIVYDGGTKMLLPQFPDDDGDYVTTEMNRYARDFFEDLGLEVTPVENHTWYKRGNLHCLVNIYK